jgi:hypothetical protein
VNGLGNQVMKSQLDFPLAKFTAFFGLTSHAE